MKKLKKIILLTSTMTTAAAPLPFLVSCGFFTDDIKKEKQDGKIIKEVPKPPKKQSPKEVKPWIELIPQQVVQPIVDPSSGVTEPIPPVILTPTPQGLEIEPWTELESPTKVPMTQLNPAKYTTAWTDLNDTVPSLLWYALEDPIKVPMTKINPATKVLWTSLNAPISSKIPWTVVDPTTNKAVIPWTSLNHPKIIIPWTFVDLTTNIMTIPWTSLDFKSNKFVIPWTEIDKATNIFRPIPWTHLNDPKSIPLISLNTPLRMPFVALNPAKVTIPWTDLSPTQITIIRNTINTSPSVNPVVPTGNTTPTTNPTNNTPTQVQPPAVTPTQTTTTTASTQPVTTQVQTPVAPIDVKTWTDINITTNIKHTPLVAVNPDTNIKHAPLTVVDPSTNVKPVVTPITSTAATQPVASSTSNPQTLYVGKPKPQTSATSATEAHTKYSANYAGSDLFGQQLMNMGHMVFNYTHLKGLYTGYSEIKPIPRELYSKGEEWFGDVDAIVAEMNKDPDISWHAIGEPYVDALNAVRYVIKKSAQGDSSLVSHIKNVVEKMWWAKGVVPPTTVRGTDFYSNAVVDINDWLLGKTQIPVIPKDNYAPAWGNPNNNYLTPRHVRDAADLATMKSVRLNEDLLKWAQYRTQQTEWRGAFDDHNPVRTNAEIGAAAGNAKGNIMNPNTKAPVVQQVPTYWAGENFVNFGALDQTNLPYGAKWHKASEMNIYRGFCHVLTTLFDETDFTLTAGHRYPTFDPQNDLIGYSITFEALSGHADTATNYNFAAAVPYIVSEMWSSQKAGAPGGRTSTYVQDGYDDKFTVVYPYDLLGTGTLSIYYDGSESQATLDRLFTQK